jgi:hypothetical protein
MASRLKKFVTALICCTNKNIAPTTDRGFRLKTRRRNAITHPRVEAPTSTGTCKFTAAFQAIDGLWGASRRD